MDPATYDKGRDIRSAVLGEAYVDNAIRNADSFTKPLQDLVTEYCWGAVWGREGLPLKTRSMLNIAMIAILNRPHELRTHVKGALTTGVTREEIREILLQVAIYVGMPAAVDAFRIVREAFDLTGEKTFERALSLDDVETLAAGDFREAFVELDET